MDILVYIIPKKISVSSFVALILAVAEGSVVIEKMIQYLTFIL